MKFNGFSVPLLVGIFLLVGFTPNTEGGRILVLFPISSKSMTNVFRPFAQGLVESHHQVTVVTPVQLNIQSANLTEMIPLTLQEIFTVYPDPFEIRRNAGMFKFPVEFNAKNCHKLFQSEQFRNLANEKFDVVIVNIIYHDCFAGLLHKIGSPIIFFASFPPPDGMTSVVGNHLPYSFIPSRYLSDISGQLTFAQRTKNFLYNVHFSVMYEMWTKPPLEVIYKEYLGSELPSINEIYRKQASMLLTNSHFSLTLPRPLLPSLVEVGGMHCVPAKPLPKDLEEFASTAKYGFIVFSLGSIVKAAQMPEYVRLAFVKTFAKLKQRVIWKWEKDGGMEDLPENVKLVKWLPQQDLLGHPNIKLFITHGGLLSTEEAVYHGTPVLGMPVFLDQDANMRLAEILGFGVKGEILDVTEEKLTPLVKKILDDPRYIMKAKELSGIFRDQKETPVERAVYWTEYVIRHKGAYHMRSSSIYLNPIQYHSIDVISVLLLAALSALVLSYLIVKFLLKLVLGALMSSGNNNGQRNSVRKQKRN